MLQYCQLLSPELIISKPLLIQHTPHKQMSRISFWEKTLIPNKLSFVFPFYESKLGAPLFTPLCARPQPSHFQGNTRGQLLHSLPRKPHYSLFPRRRILIVQDVELGFFSEKGATDIGASCIIRRYTNGCACGPCERIVLNSRAHCWLSHRSTTGPLFQRIATDIMHLGAFARKMCVQFCRNLS